MAASNIAPKGDLKTMPRRKSSRVEEEEQQGDLGRAVAGQWPRASAGRAAAVLDEATVALGEVGQARVTRRRSWTRLHQPRARSHRLRGGRASLGRWRRCWTRSRWPWARSGGGGAPRASLRRAA
jgi:hypothetical protein